MPDYQLDALGWYQFERLCQSLLHAEYGLAVEAWGGTGDHGRDAYAASSIEFPEKGKSSPGPIVFQAKFVQGANAAGSRPGPALRAAVDAEIRRIEERRTDEVWEEPGTYALLTNVSVGTALRRTLQQKIRAAIPMAERVVVVGATGFDAWLDSFPNVRLSFPQILGLRDLVALLDEVVTRDVRNRSDLALDATAQLAQVFVPTRAYNRALTTLTQHGFTVLTGAPEMGKTAIARMIALARYTAGWEAFECRGPDDFFRVYDRSHPQVFVADDAFGSTEYRPDLATAWAADLDKLVRAADYRHWVMWTSRPGPLNQGLQQLHLQNEAENFPSPAEVNVDATRLSDEERALIVYRHAKAASLPPNLAKMVRATAERIVASESFTPLRIQRLIQQVGEMQALPADQQVAAFAAAISRGLEAPTRAMQTSFNALGTEHKQLLIAMLDAGPRAVDIDELRASYARRFGGIAPRDADEIAESIEEHFVRISGDNPA